MRVLIIDESKDYQCRSQCMDLSQISVSMLDGHLFNIVAVLAEKIGKNKKKVLGSIQASIESVLG